MAQPTSGDAASAAHDSPSEHPSLPPVHDEAPDTPMWLPALGLALLAFFAVYGLLRSASSSDAELPESATAVEVAPAVEPAQ
ncbi:MAG: hypothetical protein M3Y87_02805 [Myxococcota bacterium]|nr:hypothetical protein [Myxococcota bacterium]